MKCLPKNKQHRQVHPGMQERESASCSIPMLTSVKHQATAGLELFAALIHLTPLAPPPHGSRRLTPPPRSWGNRTQANLAEFAGPCFVNRCRRGTAARIVAVCQTQDALTPKRGAVRQRGPSLAGKFLIKVLQNR